MKYATSRWYIQQMTAPALINRNAMSFASRTSQMWRDNDGTLNKITWAETGAIVKELSAGLIDMGIEKGDRVAIMCNTSPQWMWCDNAILCAGGVTVCIYPTLSETEIEFILSDSGTRVVFAEDGEILAKMKRVIDGSDKLKIEALIAMADNSAADDAIDLAALRKRGGQLLVKDPFAFENRWRSVEFSDNMTIVYTSGTTGMPKGATHTHFSYSAANCRSCTHTPEAFDDEVMMSFLPMSHTYERQCGHGTNLMTGMPIAYSSPKTLLDDLQIFKPTIFMSVPRIYERVYIAMRDQAAKSPVKNFLFNAAMNTGLKVVEAHTDKDGYINAAVDVDLAAESGPWLRFKYRLFDRLIFKKVREALGGRLRWVVSAAGSLPADLCKTFLAMGVRIMEGYGATETWNEVNVNPLTKILPGTVGPLAGSGIQGRVAEDGEWQVKGNNLFSGYWNNPEATREAFTEDGFYKTGDIVEVNPDGYVKIVDRKKGLLVLDTGKNVPSARIESMFSLSSYIDIVVPIGSDRKFVTALVVPNFDAFIQYYESKGIDIDRDSLEYSDEGSAPVCIRVGQDFIEKEEFKSIISNEIEKVNNDLESYEKIKKFHTLNYKFTPESGELTPTLKVKRRVVLDAFMDEIEEMYK